MGLFSDLAMGLGLKDRDASYYDRTAATLGRTQGAGREAQYRQSRAYTEQPTRGGPAAMFRDMREQRQGGQRGGWGYGEGDDRVSALRDMLDGGGRGRAGQRFEGGLLADLANALGIRPMGYQDRLAAARPMARPTRAAAPSGPNWAGAQGGIALEGQAPRFGNAALSFGGDGAMPSYMDFMGASPLEFGSPRPPLSVSPRDRRDLAFGAPRMGDWGSPINMSWTGPSAPAQPSQGNMGSQPTRGRPLTTLPVNAATYQPTGLMPYPSYTLDRPAWVHNPLTPSYSNIRGTGTGGGGYGYPAAGTYTF